MILFVSNVSLLKENLFVRPFGLYDDFGFIKNCMYYPKKYTIYLRREVNLVINIILSCSSL